MGKPDGFLEWDRKLPETLPPEERVKGFGEFVLERSPGAMRRQAGRCMDCGIPFCTQGCPLGNPIPDFNDAVWRDRWRTAWEHLATTNDLPEMTGRLCPAPCEKACVLTIDEAPVTIEQIEKEIAERAFQQGWVQPRPPSVRTGRKVAVVGSGPAGLAAASQLNRAGHEVTVFEASDKAGGLLRYGIPDFKLERHVLDRRLALMEAEGIAFRCRTPVGPEGRVSWKELRELHDAVVVCTGAGRARDLPLEGRDLDGVHLAMPFLEQQNRVVDGARVAADERLTAEGKRVVILGGGDTGADCHGTSLRQGAVSVTSVEVLPQPPGERVPDNPWPQWPETLRTSTSHDEGGQRWFAKRTRRFLGDAEGRVIGLEFETVTWGADGQLEVVADAPIETVEADMVILAVGFLGPITQGLVDELGVEVDSRGRIARGDDYATSVDGLWVAGDAGRGASLVVWAIAEGREAAREVDRVLRGGEAPWVRTRGMNLPFGGR